MEYADLYYKTNPEMQGIHRRERVLRLIYDIRQKIAATVLVTALAIPSNIVADWQNQAPSSTPQNFPSCSAVRLNYSQTHPSGGIAPAYICNPVMDHGTVPRIDRVLQEIET